MVNVVLLALLSGFIVGLLARWAVPGPDPMPIWMTVAFGLVGSFVGSGVAALLFGEEAVFAVMLGQIIAASLLIVAYRRFVQHRPITGPGAHTAPKRR